MSKVKTFALVLVVVMLVTALSTTFAAGPVYPELPDLEGREVVIAVENFYTPYQFNDPRSEEPIGYEYDVVNEICRRINCTPVYETTTFELQLAGVANGEYDMAMNGLFITDERKEIYDFSIPYDQSGTYLLVRADEDRFANIQEFMDNMESEELVFGVQANSFSQVIANEIYALPEDNIQVYDEFGALLVALQNGDIDTIAADAFSGKFVSATGSAFKIVGERLVDPLDIGFIFQKDSDLDEPFSAAIQSMTEDGYIDYLRYKWSTDFVPLAEE